MRLDRCTDQTRKTLDQFYEDIARSDSDNGSGQAMLDLIAGLRRLGDEPRVWGLTSLHRLCLLAQDTWQSPWYVIVAASGRTYWIEYLMPAALAPWPNGYVRGEASSESDAVQMVVTAMDRSLGWAAGHDEAIR